MTELSTELPRPNYADPPSQAGLVTGVETPFVIIMTAAVISRFYCRGALRQVLTWDDWLILPAWACFIVIFCITSYEVWHLGTARHLGDVSPPLVLKALNINLVFQICYPIGVVLSKVSVCANYMRLFPLQKINILFCKFAIAFSMAWGIATLIPQVHQFFKCPPERGTSSGVKIYRSCIDQKAFLLATASLNTASDFVIFLWPIRFLWGMKLPRDKRLGLIALFSFGLTVCIAGLIRMWYYTVFFKSTDPYWDGVWNYILVAIETNLGVACACLPCIKPVLVKLFPFAFHRSTLRSEETPKRGGGAGGGAHRHGTHHTAPSTEKGPTPLLHHLSVSWGTTLNCKHSHISTSLQYSTDKTVHGEHSGANSSEGETAILMDDSLISGGGTAAAHSVNASSLRSTYTNDDIMPEMPGRALAPDENGNLYDGMDSTGMRETWHQHAPTVVCYGV